MKQVRGGLTFREGHYICEAISETGLLVALDMMVILRGYPPSANAYIYSLGGKSFSCR